jgi:magnesium transporter
MLYDLLKPDIQELIRGRNFEALREGLANWDPAEVAELINGLPPEDDVVVFRLLSRELATRTFELLSSEKQQDLVEELARDRQFLSKILNDLSPDDRTELLEDLPPPVVQQLLKLLSPTEREIAVALLAYPPDSIGRLMTPDYVTVRHQWTIAEALDHIRRTGKDSETLNVVYVIDDHMHLLDDLRIRQLLLAPLDFRISDLVDDRFVTLKPTHDQEEAIRVFRTHDRVALPVTDPEGVLLGIVTVDDVLDVIEEEATEDIQKIGGSEALDDTYLNTTFASLIKKRARWLVVLFIGEMLTASAMAYFEQEIAQVVILALFVPLIISSGGNSGSQAATLIIRALAVGEVRLGDWWRVMKREIMSGLLLGTILGSVGILRVTAWQHMFRSYGPHWLVLALTVGVALVGVVLLGTLAGSMLPFLLKRIGADPAASSAPFVATIVDVTGLVIYFSVAALLLGGLL